MPGSANTRTLFDWMYRPRKLKLVEPASTLNGTPARLAMNTLWCCRPPKWVRRTWSAPAVTASRAAASLSLLVGAPCPEITPVFDFAVESSTMIAQPRPELLEAGDDVGLVQVVGEDVERDRRIGHRLVEQAEDQVDGLEAHPAIDVARPLGEGQAVVGARGDDGLADGVDVGVVREAVAKRLRRGEAAGEADVDEAGVGHRVERDLQRDRGAGLEHAVARHVHLGAAIAVEALLRLEREVDPAELLERRLLRRIRAVAGHGLAIGSS